MFQHWTKRRRASLIFHVGVVLIPFSFATMSALLFWQSLFQSWWLAAPMVAVIDVLALLGLVLHIARIPSPFQVMRHVLPFVSVVPLGLELYQLLAPHNAAWLSVVVALIVTAIMTALAWRCYVTIERLFVSPATAAREATEERLAVMREQTAEQVRVLTATLIAATDLQVSIATAVQDWSERTDIRVSVAPPVLTGPVVSSQAVRAFADQRGVSERTVWRQLKTGKLTVGDLVNEEEGV